MNGRITLYRVCAIGRNGNPIHWDCSTTAQVARVCATLRSVGLVPKVLIAI